MRDVVGQERVVRWLQSAFQQKRLAHAYLFTDSHTRYIKKMAVELAKTLNCEQKGLDACDSCPTCIQIEHGNHPDVVSIQPDGSYIKIDQVRAVQATFRYRAPNEIQRVLIIESAEKMRLETANSLLKFLEEPISPMVAILLTNKKERILPTICSRCQWVRFSAPAIHLQQKMFLEEGFHEPVANLLSHLHFRDELVQLESHEIEQNIENLVQWSKAFLTGDESALIDVQVGWLANELEQGRSSSLLELLLIWLKELMNKNSSFFSKQHSMREKIRLSVKENDILVAMDNVLIASRLVHKAEISTSAIWEQMVIATQEKRKSKYDDWRMIVI
jgi:DNA polymerase-3 subunit delta'